MHDVGERLQRRPQLDREHKLAHDLAGTRRDQCRADEHAATAVGYQLHRAPVKVVNVASCGLIRIGAATTTSMPLARAEASDNPTDAVSGSVYVTRGTAP